MANDAFKSLLETHWEEIYNFCLRMCLDEDRAIEACEESFLRAYVGFDSAPEEKERTRLWLLKIAQHVALSKVSRTPEVSFDLLDDTLRSEATRTDVVSSLAEPRRDFLLWELKQGCMTSVVNCLSPGERAAFILGTILNVENKEAAATLEITEAAYKVRLSRARKKIADYLAPRCEHVDPMNPCRCPARVGVALRKGFIKPSGGVDLRSSQHSSYGRYGSGPEQADAPLRDIVAIYGNLPAPKSDVDVLERLVSKLESGEWDNVKSGDTPAP